MKRREFLKTATVAVAGSGAVVAAPAIVRAEESFSFKMTNAYPPNAPFYVAGPGSPTDFCKKV
jgi:TRAP-type mannitol/chloroaromatic compound transport system substrate-binding protein